MASLALCAHLASGARRAPPSPCRPRALPPPVRASTPPAPARVAPASPLLPRRAVPPPAVLSDSVGPRRGSPRVGRRLLATGS
eukprot:775442-Pleurochrysis_carterae.AAC.1